MKEQIFKEILSKMKSEQTQSTVAYSTLHDEQIPHIVKFKDDCLMVEKK